MPGPPAKERDTETSNDDFGARYYSWRFGRWLSADWSAVPVPVPYANLTNPQTLNLYSMVADDPESFADLDGHQSPQADQNDPCSVTPNSCGAKSAGSIPSEQTKKDKEAQAAVSILYYVRIAMSAQNALGLGHCWCQNAPPQQVQDAINRGEPPNGEYSLLLGKQCPDCKYYPKEVQEAVDAHEEQHRKDEHSPSGFFKLFTKKGRAELEVGAFKAELAVVERHLKSLESFVGPPTQAQQQTRAILNNMRDQAIGAIQNPSVYVSAP